MTHRAPLPVSAGARRVPQPAGRPDWAAKHGSRTGMYQNVLFAYKRALIVAAAMIVSATAASAQTDPGCRDAIANAARKYTNGAMKVMQKCEEGRLKGKVMGTCPDSAASTKLADLAGKLSAKVTGSCTTLADTGFVGKVNRCTGGLGNGNRCVDHFDCEFPPVGMDPNDGTCDPVDECPAFLNGTLFDGCEIPLSTPQTVADCIE